ncbi:hypothetical protein DB30_07280 [Enhygromyxa salina]|uniref:Archaeal ATPase n=1 Tax=Enhygromyxa salina TaxID=215803 RepID=A0A0C1ZSQ1_9BACT|nr:ATP-binding protein [Enhygromyxa salina]KIG14093.1 hypothetical protein DB30_07280 [Enhygromyxa salina]
MSIRNTIGSPVEGQNFYDREEMQARLWDRLETDHVLLLAPRRVGKTSLLYKLEATAETHNFKAIFASVASHSTELAFLHALLEILAGDRGPGAKIVSRAQKLLDRVKKLSVDKISVELEMQQWQDIGAELLQILRTVDGRCVLMLDELPIFVLNLLRVHGRERARLFLNWFRHVRGDRQARLGVRWLVCGSIGLDTVTQRERLGDTINDLAIVRLGGFSREHARDFLADLAATYSIELSDEVNGHILDKIDWLIPYHLQLLFSMVRDLEVITPDIASVDQAYDRLLTNSHKSYFDTWVQRLLDELGPIDEDHALALLEAAARDTSGAPKSVMRELMHGRGADEQLTRYLLGVLESDGYLVEDSDRWRFRSPLLRDYWRSMVLS